MPNKYEKIIVGASPWGALYHVRVLNLIINKIKNIQKINQSLKMFQHVSRKRCK